MMMRKLLAAVPLSLAPISLALAQAAAKQADKPVEPAGTESVVIFGVVVLAGLVGFVIFMAKSKNKDSADKQ